MFLSQCLCIFFIIWLDEQNSIIKYYYYFFIIRPCEDVNSRNICLCFFSELIFKCPLYYSIIYRIIVFIYMSDSLLHVGNKVSWLDHHWRNWGWCVGRGEGGGKIREEWVWTVERGMFEEKCDNEWLRG